MCCWMFRDSRRSLKCCRGLSPLLMGSMCYDVRPTGQLIIHYQASDMQSLGASSNHHHVIPGSISTSASSEACMYLVAWSKTSVPNGSKPSSFLGKPDWSSIWCPTHLTNSAIEGIPLQILRFQHPPYLSRRCHALKQVLGSPSQCWSLRKSFHLLVISPQKLSRPEPVWQTTKP